MDRAEERAIEAYPVKIGTFHEPDIHYEADLNLASRKKYIEGYHQAEKDNALTWDDIRTLFRIADNYDSELNKPGYLTLEYCEEVLRRFNAERERNESH